MLQGVSFGVNAGEKVALVGFSGCGKSTIAQLVVRLYDPDAGSIYVNDCDVRELGRRELRSIVSLVPQEPVLFDTTLRENLLYGDSKATARDLDRIASQTQLEDLLRRLPKGLDEPLGPFGKRLSGGEKKRVALARAILRNPRILILDEVTGALDGYTSSRLLMALEELCREMTIILISHKPQTIAWADRTMIIDRGKIVDQGTHQELLSRCSLYASLCGTDRFDDVSERNAHKSPILQSRI